MPSSFNPWLLNLYFPPTGSLAPVEVANVASPRRRGPADNNMPRAPRNLDPALANQFNEFFVNIGSKLAQTIPNVDTQKTVNSYLTNKTSSAFKFKLITEEDIFKIISKLDSKNSACYDQISSNLLKRINEYIHKPLTLIVNQSLSSGIFPNKLKIAKIIIDQYLCCLLFQKFLKKLCRNN